MTVQRGKYAEGKIKDFLEMWKQKVAGFTYNRIADARSAMGAMSNPQPGDFQWFLKHEHDMEAWTGDKVWHGVPYTRNGLIESKETEHDFRLPYASFGPDQVGRMVIRQMAGSECIVLICHRVKGVRGVLWRQVPLDFFRERPGAKYGSWDLTQFPTSPNLSAFLEPYLS